MKKPYRLIIVDDEEPARDLIEFYTSQISDLICVAVCNSAIQAIEALHKFKPDLMILDICMPEMSGIDLITLRLPNCPDTILATAYPEFAARSYEFSVLDYLVKPISFERFSQSIEKFRLKRNCLGEGSENQSRFGVESKANYHKPLLQPNKNAATSVWLREEKRLMQIPYECIFYVEGSKDYIKVFLKDHFVLTHMTIGKAEELFPPPRFVRIHRSHIVRQEAIRLIDGNMILLTNGAELQIGPCYRDGLKKYVSALR